MESSLVIKVQHANTLRRFNARVNGNGSLDLDMPELTAKICSLFPFPPDAELTLTYTDEDGDVVTLVDDNDLRDVMKQQLKFLKIFVSLKDEGNTGWSYARSSGSSTPLPSPRVQQPLPNINAVVSEAMKSVPELLREAFSKLSQDFVLEAAFTTPNFVDAIEQLTRNGQSILNPAPQTPANVSTDSAPTRDTSVDPAPKKPEAKDVGKDVGSSGAASSAATPSVSVQAPDSSVKTLAGAKLLVSNLNVGALGKGKETKKDINEEKYSQSTAAQNVSPPCPAVVPSQCPFSGIPPMSVVTGLDGWGRRSKRGHKHQVATATIFHRGIRCDVCGVYPIVGDRYKSLVKEDYDLCSICFNVQGKDADYIRLEKPVSHRDMFPSHQHPWGPIPFAHRGVRLPCGIKRGVPKLDSRFVSDVTIVDGTVMAPMTPFTKIWRMRNNGNFIWSRGIKLVWIGGDRLDDKDSVEIVIPPEGISVDSELDIAVDFASPRSPGRYHSYWRMVSPSGQKFGQRVWLLIQVDASLDDSFPKELNGLNLNLPLPPASFFGAGNTEPVKLEEHDFPTNDELLVGNVAVVASAPPESSSSVAYPVVDTSDVVPVVLTPPAVPAGSADADAGMVDAVEASLLKELEEMGFKQIDLNKDVLRMNGYDLEQSVDELCGVANWDPILEDLRDMGFCDKEVNNKLLKKHNGSIKRVVMDLLTEEKA